MVEISILTPTYIVIGLRVFLPLTTGIASYMAFLNREILANAPVKLYMK